MVIQFANEKVRDFLLKNGMVYTYRAREHKDGRDWANSGRGTKKIADVEIWVRDWGQLWSHSQKDMLGLYVEKSSFDSVDEWFDAIKALNKGVFPKYGYMLEVRVR